MCKKVPKNCHRYGLVGARVIIGSSPYKSWTEVIHDTGRQKHGYTDSRDPGNGLDMLSIFALQLEGKWWKEELFSVYLVKVLLGFQCHLLVN